LAEAPLPSSQDAMTAGAAAYEAGRYGDAVAAYQQAVAAQPDNATYRQALAAALIRSGDREAGLAEYRQVLRRDPDNALARLRLAVVRAEDEGPSPEVLEELSRVVESAPELVEARLELGRLLVEAGRPAEALPHLQRAVEAAPEDLEARQRYGRLLLSLQRLPEARRELEAALELGGDDAETLLALGLLEKAAGDAEAARRYLLQVVEQEVDAPRRAGLALVQLARLAEERGDAAEALTHWQAAAELTPRALTVQLGLSAARVAGGLVAEAVAGLEEAVAAADDDQNRAVLLFNLGVLRQRQGEVGAAADAYRRAVELAPGMDEAQFNLAALLLGQGRFDSAADRFQRVLEANPADGAARRGLALAYQRAGRWREARAALEAGLEASPGDVVLSHQLARLLAVCPQEEVRDPARALELASAALDEQATLPRVETFSMALAAAGRFDEAVEWQQRLLSEAEGAGVPEAELRRLRRNLERYQRGEAAEASS
jgi:tetratricopeptide (TPR) repeat protein